MKHIKKLRLIKESSELDNAFLSLCEDYKEVSFSRNILSIRKPIIPNMRSIDDVSTYLNSLDEYKQLISELMVCLGRVDTKFVTSDYDNRLDFRFITNTKLIYEDDKSVFVDISGIKTQVIEWEYDFEDFELFSLNNSIYISMDATIDSDEAQVKMKEIFKRINSNIEYKFSFREKAADDGSYYYAFELIFNKKLVNI